MYDSEGKTVYGAKFELNRAQISLASSCDRRVDWIDIEGKWQIMMVLPSGTSHAGTKFPQINPTAYLRLPKIPASYCTTLGKRALAQTANSTKTFHVKHFCPIEAGNRTFLMRYLLTGSKTGRTHPARTKLSSTNLRPALSKSMVSLLPSTAATVPAPNFV